MTAIVFISTQPAYESTDNSFRAPLRCSGRGEAVPHVASQHFRTQGDTNVIAFRSTERTMNYLVGKPGEVDVSK